MNFKQILISKAMPFGVALIIFSGCAASKAVDKSFIKVDENVYIVKNTYEDTTHYVSSSYTNLSNFISDTTGDIYENSLMKMLISDDSILEKRKDLVIWKDNNSENSKYIIQKSLKKEKSEIDYDGLSISQKINILNKYYFNLQEQSHLSTFLKKYKKPEYDEYKTDRENIEAVNFYTYQLNISKNKWKIKLPEIQKEIAKNILSSLYGKPKVSNITYDPNEKTIFMQLVSSRENFSQKISFDVTPIEAKTLKTKQNYLKPNIYFKFKENNMVLIGASIGFKKKEYLAHFTNKLYQRENTLQLSNDNDLNLAKLEVNYKIKATDIKNPDWFYNIPENGNIIGYGSGETEDAAKNTALKNIAQTLEVDVKSNIDVNKKRDGSQYSSKVKQNINVSTKSKKLKGSKTINSQKKDGIWFVAVSYTK